MKKENGFQTFLPELCPIILADNVRELVHQDLPHFGLGEPVQRIRKQDVGMSETDRNRHPDFTRTSQHNFSFGIRFFQQSGEYFRLGLFDRYRV